MTGFTNKVVWTGVGVLVVAALSVGADAQTPPASASAPPATVAPATAPHYVAIPLEIVVNKPVAEVWGRIGKYCDIGEWLQVACTITSGKDNEVGTVRSIGTEVLVGKTEYSYTYTQPVRPNATTPYNLYHGTLEARAITATSTKILYTLMYDNSMLADDAAREADRARRATQFTRALENMKILCEGGTLPPPPARGAGRGAGRGAN